MKRRRREDELRWCILGMERSPIYREWVRSET